ncbi:MAG: hypothetical protein MK132_17060 [Lentisphaerales bacterium]|nr:hypothetical protein [Lentisphaerales bacterium]
MLKHTYTLLELVIVAAIMAVIGGAATLAVSSSESLSQNNLLKVEQTLIYDALVKFRKDMGYYPKIGPLDKDIVELDNDTLELEEDMTEEEFEEYENLLQLFQQPVDKNAPDKWDWNIYTKRGWNGPYLNLNAHNDFKIPILGKNSPIKNLLGNLYYYRYNHNSQTLAIWLSARHSPTGENYKHEIKLP